MGWFDDDFNKWNVGNRIRNMVWTVGGKYDAKVDITSTKSAETDGKDVKISDPEVLTKYGLSRKDAMNVSLYTSAHEGSHLKYSDMKTFIEALKQANEEYYDMNTFNGLCQLVEDARVDGLTSKYRPGFGDMREDALRSLTPGITPTGDDREDVIRILSLESGGIDVKKLFDWTKRYKDFDKAKISNVLDMIKDVPDLTQEEALNRAKAIYDTLFGKPEEPEPEEEEEPGEGEDDTEEDMEDIIKGHDPVPGSEREVDEDSEAEPSDGDSEDVEDSEKTPGEAGVTAGKGGSESPVKLSEDALKDMAEKLSKSSPMDIMDKEEKERLEELKHRKAYKEKESDKLRDDFERDAKNIKKRAGKDLWTPNEKAERERMYCRGEHAGTNLYYADPYDKDSKDGTVASLSKRNYRTRDSRDTYHKSMKTKADGTGRYLAGVFRESFRASKDDEAYTASSGKFSVKRSHHIPTGGNVFTKTEYDEEGGFVVDVVLDASGSMGMREDNLAYNAYALTKGLTDAGIPTRVVTFRNERATQVVERLKDYDSKDVEGVLGYYAGGENRDGLALAMIGDELLRRSEAHKIMIVFSDGCPCDGNRPEIVSKMGGSPRYVADFRPEGHKTAVEDTAHVIRKLRSSDVAVMGVFYGNAGRDLEMEKKMYGNDFAFIQNVNNFAPQAVKYIKKQIMAVTE